MRKRVIDFEHYTTGFRYFILDEIKLIPII